jgi:hypothetical protein
MSHDLTIKYVVKIETSTTSGTGVIFKSDKKSNIFYVITAKHIFGNEVSSILIKKEEIKIYRETSSTVNIINNDIDLVILENQNIDICILVIPKEKTNIENELEIHYLEIFDMDDYSIQKLNFFISGYPSFLNSIDRSSKLMPYTLQHIQFESNDNVTARLSCKSSHIISPRSHKEMQGISGAGVFVQETKYIVNLSHIHHNSPSLNIFLATRLDIFVDDFNDSLIKLNKKLPLIKTSTHVIIDDVNIEEFGNFSFLEEKSLRDVTAHKKVINENFSIEIKSEISDRRQATKISNDLKKIHDKINELSESLSHLYVYYAVLAHKKEKRRLTSLFFKKAIELNPEHKNTFIQEKAARTNNLEKIQEIAAFSLADTIKFHDELMEDNSDNNITKISKIKNAIIALMEFKKDDERDEKIQKYLKLLEELYKENKTLREPYKYKELGEFYLTIFEDKKALEFLYLAYFILEESPQSEANSLTLEELKKTLVSLEDDIGNIDEIKNKAQIYAKDILVQEEDATIKEHLKKSNKMIGVIYDDIYQIKQEEYRRNETILNLENTLRLLKTKIEIQINQNNSYNLDTVLINENIVKLDTFNNLLTEQLKDIPEKYNIQIDENTRSELRSIIEEPASAISSTLNKIDVITDKASTYVENAENSFNTLVKHGKDDLLIINSSIQENLSSLSEQKIKLENDKNEVLAFLKSSEKRMLAHIQKLELNTKRKNDAIAFIQNKIYGLQKLVSKALLVQSDNHSDIIELSNKSTQELKQITLACQQLEKQLQESLDYTSDIESIKRAQTRVEHTLVTKTSEALFTHAQYHDDIIAIKHNQNRFEESLLNQTNHALKNYERIVDYNIRNPPLSFGKKVLLALYFIIMISSATYFIVNYGLLDLLEHLWQTA